MSQATIASLISYFNLANDPSHRHYEALLSAERDAVADSCVIMARMQELQQQLNTCCQRIAQEIPELTTKFDLLVRSPLFNEQESVDEQEVQQQLAMLKEIISLLQSDQTFAELCKQKDEITRKNGEKEQQLDTLKKQLTETHHLIEGYRTSCKQEEQNLFTLIALCQKLQNKMGLPTAPNTLNYAELTLDSKNAEEKSQEKTIQVNTQTTNLVQEESEATASQRAPAGIDLTLDSNTIEQQSQKAAAQLTTSADLSHQEHSVLTTSPEVANTISLEPQPRTASCNRYYEMITTAVAAAKTQLQANWKPVVAMMGVAILVGVIWGKIAGIGIGLGLIGIALITLYSIEKIIPNAMVMVDQKVKELGEILASRNEIFKKFKAETVRLQTLAEATLPALIGNVEAIQRDSEAGLESVNNTAVQYEENKKFIEEALSMLSSLEQYLSEPRPPVAQENLKSELTFKLGIQQEKQKIQDLNARMDVLSRDMTQAAAQLQSLTELKGKLITAKDKAIQELEQAAQTYQDMYTRQAEEHFQNG